MKDIAYIGIDPGAKGSFCLLVPATKQVAFWPTDGKPLEALNWLWRADKELNVRIIMIEEVHSLFGMSAKSNFSFGYNVGIVNTLSSISEIGVDKVTPKKWQKLVGVRAKGKEIKKDVAGICERLYPKASIRGPRGGLLDGLSDALMIAHYASLTYNQEK